KEEDDDVEHTKTNHQFSFPEPPLPTTTDEEAAPSPLHLAAQRGDIEAVKQLLDSDLAQPTDVDDQGITALHWSAINSHLNLSSLLISRGAMVDAFGGQLLATPLIQAFNTLHLATHSSSALTLSYLLSCSYDQIRHSLSVDLLLSHQASVSARDLNGMTPLHWAVVKGNLNCIRQIVAAGADVLARTIEGKTPQEMAIELKSSFAWYRALSEAGLNSDGTPRILPLGNGLKMKSCMFIFTIMSFGLGFITLSSLPFYSSILISLAQAYGTHHIITTTFLDAKNLSPSRPSEIITRIHVFPHTQDHSTLNYSSFRHIIEGLVEQTKFDGMNFCITCENRKPLRSKHCKICRRCIGKFDHHCPWVWNCVGVGNHRQFLIFVGTLIIGISLFDVLSYIYDYVELSNVNRFGYMGGRADFWTAGNHLGINYLELFEVPEGGFKVQSKQPSTNKLDLLKSSSSSTSSNNARLNNGYERVAMDIV
ncbi:hypothetical protein H4Q26_011198, partial [Puccinia striiformis f. sp. tritici PST-130]